MNKSFLASFGVPVVDIHVKGQKAARRMIMPGSKQVILGDCALLLKEDGRIVDAPELWERRDHTAFSWVKAEPLWNKDKAWSIALVAAWGALVVLAAFKLS